jgi:glucose/arabinose dehydrogenase
MNVRHLVVTIVLGLGLGLFLGCQGGPSDTGPEASTQGLTCDPGSGDIELPEGFCAIVVADDLGRARHLAVNDNGDVYVARRQQGEGEPPGGVVALRDTDGDGRADVIERFGDHYGTGIELYEGRLYFGTDQYVVRYEMADGELVPSGEPEMMIDGFPEQRSHAVKPFAFDDQGNLFVNVGGPSNACQEESRTPGSPGQRPCPQLEWQASIWRFDANRPGQTQQADGYQYSRGIRNSVAIAWDPFSKSVYVAQHGRDQLNQLWPELFDENDNAENPAEEFLRLSDGADFMWPYCYYDTQLGRKILAPEYGGDGETVGECADSPEPLVAFPGHWGPNDLLFYQGSQFPEKYRGGAFLAFHGSWNRAPLPQGGYNVVFVPMSAGEVTGDWEVFASGFPGQDPLERPQDARFRPTGVAEGPDGSLYVSDSVQGRIWRIIYIGA